MVGEFTQQGGRFKPPDRMILNILSSSDQPSETTSEELVRIRRRLGDLSRWECKATEISRSLVNLLVGTYVKERDNNNNKGKVVRLVWYSGLRSIYLFKRDTGEARILI